MSASSEDGTGLGNGSGMVGYSWSYPKTSSALNALSNKSNNVGTWAWFTCLLAPKEMFGPGGFTNSAAVITDVLSNSITYRGS